MNTTSNIIEFAKKIKKGTFGLYVVTNTEKKMNVFPIDKAAAKVRNPYIGRVRTIAVYQNGATGVNYYNIVKGECKREGIEFSDEEFAQEFPHEETYCECNDNELSNIIFTHKTSGQQYLRLYVGRKPTKVKYFTLIDGEIVSDNDARLTEIAAYTPAKYESKKQAELGIANIVGVRQPKIENVIYLMQGGNECGDISGLLQSLKISSVKELFG